MDKASLQAHLHGGPSSDLPTPSKLHVPDAQPLLHHPNTKKVCINLADIFDSNEQEDVGLFEILDDMPATNISKTGVTIRV